MTFKCIAELCEQALIDDRMIGHRSIQRGDQQPDFVMLPQRLSGFGAVLRKVFFKNRKDDLLFLLKVLVQISFPEINEPCSRRVRAVLLGLCTGKAQLPGLNQSVMMIMR